MRIPRLFQFGPKQGNVSAGVFVEDGCVRYVQATFENDRRCAIVLHSEELALTEETAAHGQSRDESFCRSVFAALSVSGVPKDVPLAYGFPFAASAIRLMDGEGLLLEEARSTLRLDFKRHFAFAEQEAAYDIAETKIPTDKNGTGRAFLIAASRKREIETLARMSAEHGYTLEAIEPGQLALERGLASIQSTDSGVSLTVFCDAGRLFCSLSVERQPFFFHLQKPVTPEETVKELLNALQFASAWHRTLEIRRVHLFGNAIPEIEEIEQLCGAFVYCRTLDDFADRAFQEKNAA